jgi:hypothetical protein
MLATDPDVADEGIVSLYIATFAGRDDLYVENGAGVVREPLEPEVVRKALRHSYPVSAYLGTADGRTHVGAIDFDREDGLELAHKIERLLDQHDIPAMVGESRRGAHLWVTSVDQTSIGTMHRMLKAAVALVCGQETADDPKVEVFPKHGSEELAVGALRLPGLPHQKTQQVYPVWFGGYNKCEQPTFRDLIVGQQLTTSAAIERLAGKGPPIAAYPKDVGEFYGHKPERDWGEDPSASEILLAWGVPNAKPGGTVNCPKHNDKRRSLTVFKDDERVFCGAPHCVLHGSGHGVGSVLLGRME